MANSLNGFIKLHRKLVAWGWYQDYVVKDVFLHLLLTANFKDTSWRDITLKEGQLVTGTKKLAEDLGFSRQQVRTALDKLKSTNEITIKSTNKYSIITVVNWGDYQSSEESLTNTSTKSATNEQPTHPVNKLLTSLINLQNSTNKSTSKEELESLINRDIEKIIKEVSTSTLTNEQPTSNQQITNEQPQRKNNKNNKNKRNKKEINKEKSSAASPEPPLRAVGLSEGQLDLHKFKPDGTPLPKDIIELGLTWDEFMEIKNQ